MRGGGGRGMLEVRGNGLDYGCWKSCVESKGERNPSNKQCNKVTQHPHKLLLTNKIEKHNHTNGRGSYANYAFPAESANSKNDHLAPRSRLMASSKR